MVLSSHLDSFFALVVVHTTGPTSRLRKQARGGNESGSIPGSRDGGQDQAPLALAESGGDGDRDDENRGAQRSAGGVFKFVVRPGPGRWS